MNPMRPSQLTIPVETEYPSETRIVEDVSIRKNCRHSCQNVWWITNVEARGDYMGNVGNGVFGPWGEEAQGKIGKKIAESAAFGRGSHGDCGDGFCCVECLH